MKLILLLISVLVVFGAGYYVVSEPDDTPDSGQAVQADSETDSDMLTFTVAPEKVDCVGVGPRQCLVVNGENFFASIEGFDFEPGYQHVIQVNRAKRENVPADASTYEYTLVEEISKTPAAGFAVSLKDSTWQWQQTLKKDDEVITPAQAEAFTLFFRPENRFSVTTDCNNGMGEYTRAAESLTFSAMAATKKACLAESQEAEFFAMIAAVETYDVTVEGNLMLQTDEGEMLFTPIPVTN
jgi:heat shock protein HslJ